MLFTFLSLGGIPPLGGFLAKYYVFASAIKRAGLSDGNSWLYWVVGVGLDFLFLSADLSYELGLTTAVEVVQPDGVISAKNNVLRFSVGFRI